MKYALWIAALAALLSACGEKPQRVDVGKRDVAPYIGTDNGFAVGGWTQGDKTSWQSELKARTERGQNDYSRMN